ncbi:hypothetical protein F0P96_14430 [Hymenobacter busanensis]|uniref:Uncharacterized protein n=1 Tax=Hymenobacter busanensis TaxID=2607656 RepID=A0A7L4ZZ97_9BACT|nr:hypothetical protein [Hymenobacter busanensis]KAA9331437.1 hypothetical protein F0P96_14430 [Hymenobacter busanensis]QHJ08591.1 hypothetical protein GUY19_15360 [Hymenobacter busanensis]
MKSFFRALYEVIGLPQPSSETPVYREVIFPNIGLLNIGITLALLVLFYLVINRYMRVATFSRPRHWALFLGLNALIAFVIVIAQANGQNVESHSYIYWLALLNAIYAAVFFFILSLIFRKLSVNASTTPF